MKYCVSCGAKEEDNIEMCNKCGSLFFQKKLIKQSIDFNGSEKNVSNTTQKSILTRMGLLKVLY